MRGGLEIPRHVSVPTCMGSGSGRMPCAPTRRDIPEEQMHVFISQIRRIRGLFEIQRLYKVDSFNMENNGPHFNNRTYVLLVNYDQ